MEVKLLSFFLESTVNSVFSLNKAKQYLMSVIKKDRKTYSFREGMPEDVYQIILREQNRIKEEKSTTQYSMERTIYNIIREFDRLKKLEDKK